MTHTKPTKKKATKADYHEVADRVSIMESNFGDFIVDHKGIDDKKSKKLVKKIINNLGELYQHVAVKMF